MELAERSPVKSGKVYLAVASTSTRSTISAFSRHVTWCLSSLRMDFVSSSIKTHESGVVYFTADLPVLLHNHVIMYVSGLKLSLISHWYEWVLPKCLRSSNWEFCYKIHRSSATWVLSLVHPCSRLVAHFITTRWISVSLAEMSKALLQTTLEPYCVSFVCVFNFGFLHPVACVRSGYGGFYPSMQCHYRRLIYYLYYIATCFGRTTIIRQKYINS
jgi:hypothetical protein